MKKYTVNANIKIKDTIHTWVSHNWLELLNLSQQMDLFNNKTVTIWLTENDFLVYTLHQDTNP